MLLRVLLHCISERVAKLLIAINVGAMMININYAKSHKFEFFFFYAVL